MQIDPFLPDIVSMVSSNVISSLISQTGSGKSLRTPAVLADDGYRCFVTVPTRTSAISLSEYQKTINPDLKVGYAAEGNIKYDNKTAVAYVTSGHARKKMLSYFKNGKARDITFSDVLMVDEVHAGSIDTSVIIPLWIKAATSGVTVPRLLLASATPVDLNIKPPPVTYEVKLQTYPIEISYLDKDLDFDSDELYFNAAQYAAQIHLDTDISTGHIIVFVPGKSDVVSVMGEISKLVNGNVEILPAYGSLDPDQMKLIYQDTPGKRKIIVATNVAEMSITIGDVGYIIDSMLEKRSETSNSGGLRLNTTYESKDSAIQRAGRTGRTRPGVCYRLCTLEKYNSLEQHRPPEIERVPIYEQVLELYSVGLNPSEILATDPKRITDATKLLNKLGMVIFDDDGSATITDMGIFAPKFPLSVRNAAFLWNWIHGKYPIFPGVIVAAIIDTYGPPYFWYPRREHEESIKDYNKKLVEYKKLYFDKYRGSSDLETALNVWSELISLDSNPNKYAVTISQKASSDWARKNSINNKKIRELINNVNQCLDTLVKLGYTVNKGLFTPVNVINAARPIFSYIYPTLIGDAYGSNYFDPETGEKYMLDSRESVNKFSENHPPAVLSLISAEIKSRRGAIRIVGFALDTDKDALGNTINSRKTPKTTLTQKDAENIDSALAMLSNLGFGTGTASTKSKPPTKNPRTPQPKTPPPKPKTPQQKLQRTVQYIQDDPPYDYNVKELFETYTKDEIINGLLENIQSEGIQFPLTSSFGYPPEVLFNNLKNTDPEVVKVSNYKIRSYNPKYNTYLPPKFREVPTILATKENTYNTVDVLSDYFIEDLRLKAKRYDQDLSVVECWSDKECLTKIINKVLQKERVRPETLRGAVYETIMEVTTFKPTWARGLLKLVIGENLENLKWLDISVGWGDRLLAAMSLNMDYTGFDPNVELAERHSVMIEMFGDPDKQRIFYQPFETAELPDEEYDVVLTSPPYYNIEEYVPDQEGQSIISYPSFEQWMVHFMFTALNKAWNALKIGGYLILHLGDSRDIHLAEPTNIFIESYLPGASWEGIVGIQSESGYPRPVWVWKKVSESETRNLWQPNNKKQLAYEDRTLDKTYPDINNEILKLY